MLPKKKLQLVLLVLLLSLLCSNFVCNKYAKAGELAKDFASGVSAFNDVEIEFHKQGKLSDDEHIKLQTLLLQVEEAGKSLDNAIVTTHNTADAKSALDVSFKNLQAMLDGGVLHIKNEEVKASLKTSLVLLKSILDNILVLGGGK